MREDTLPERFFPYTIPNQKALQKQSCRGHSHGREGGRVPTQRRRCCGEGDRRSAIGGKKHAPTGGGLCRIGGDVPKEKGMRGAVRHFKTKRGSAGTPGPGGGEPFGGGFSGLVCEGERSRVGERCVERYLWFAKFRKGPSAPIGEEHPERLSQGMCSVRRVLEPRIAGKIRGDFEGHLRCVPKDQARQKEISGMRDGRQRQPAEGHQRQPPPVPSTRWIRFRPGGPHHLRSQRNTRPN